MESRTAPPPKPRECPGRGRGGAPRVTAMSRMVITQVNVRLSGMEVGGESGLGVCGASGQETRREWTAAQP